MSQHLDPPPVIFAANSEFQLFRGRQASCFPESLSSYGPTAVNMRSEFEKRGYLNMWGLYGVDLRYGILRSSASRPDI